MKFQNLFNQLILIILSVPCCRFHERHSSGLNNVKPIKDWLRGLTMAVKCLYMRSSHHSTCNGSNNKHLS